MERVRAVKQAVERFIKRHQLLKDGETIIVGVSGGPDSMALLDYLESVRGKWSLTIIAASADHGLRGGESANDVRYVERWCGDRNITFEGTLLDVTSYQKEHGVSVQTAARACRYDFFAKVMRSYAADKLALAHHGDDQIETMLMRQVRGSVGEARSGIPVRRPFARGEIIRPFLAVDRRQIEAYCREQGIDTRRDPSNDSDHYTRNRFRHHVLPFLKKENPNVHIRFQHESETLREDNLYLEQLAKERLDDVTMSKQPDEVVLSVEALSNMPIALQRRMIQLVLNYLYMHTPPSLSAIHMKDLLQLLGTRQPSGRLDFPWGLRVVRSYGRLLITYKKKEHGGCAYQHTLQVPGGISFSRGSISAETEKDLRKQPDDRDTFVCDADLVDFPLTVRTRQSGDCLSLKGMKGSKKVKAIFIDQKVPVDLRSSWPLVCAADGTVLWLPLLKHSGVARVSKETNRLLILRYKRGKEV